MASFPIGTTLRALYLHSGRKMAVFAEAVNFDPKTCYYHFKQEDLNTSILEKYEAGLKKLGYKVDVFDLVARMRRGQSVEQAMEPAATIAAEPPATYQAMRSAELLDNMASTMHQVAEELAELRRMQHGRPGTPAGQPAPEK